MARKAQREEARAKKTKATKKDGTATTAKRVSRTPGAVKKSAAGKRGKKKPKIDPEVEATKTRNRALWKSQAKEATSVELAKQGALVDERARVRSLTGMSWSNRKPR